MLGTPRLIPSSKVSSTSKHLDATHIGRSLGTLVNNETTSTNQHLVLLDLLTSYKLSKLRKITNHRARFSNGNRSRHSLTDGKLVTEQKKQLKHLPYVS
jgi:hypothetical protein